MGVKVVANRKQEEELRPEEFISGINKTDRQLYNVDFSGVCR